MKPMTLLYALLAAATCVAAQAPAPVPAGAYTLDKAHASLIFRVNHIGFSNYTRRFKRFDAKLQFDPANKTAITDPTYETNRDQIVQGAHAVLRAALS